MDRAGNIVIGDESALFFLLHADAGKRVAERKTMVNPLEKWIGDAGSLTAFNVEHPLYGGKPVILLVPHRDLRRKNSDIFCRQASSGFPAGSFFELREGLFMATPECAFMRAASTSSIGELVALGTNLCARYYLSCPSEEIHRRSAFLTTPEQLQQYLSGAEGLRGSQKAKVALQYIGANSGSPEETNLWVLFNIPICYGGFGLGFTHMNYDVKAGRLATLSGQGQFEIDLADIKTGQGAEYDGADYHQDASADKRRRNDLKALGWDIYPIDSSVLYNSQQTIVAAKQLAKLMHRRLRLGEGWEGRYVELRKSLCLPV